MRVKITWNGQGGELDVRTVEGSRDSDALNKRIRDALLEMIEIGELRVGDSFVVEEA